jgi:hypothetical protein
MRGGSPEAASVSFGTLKVFESLGFRWLRLKKSDW